jgi:uncharacterized repeat protein (TIGR03803 family)
MGSRFLHLNLTCLLVALMGALLLAKPLHAQTETVLYSFGSQPGDGLYPDAGLVIDKNGNLYGTTNQGGAEGPVYGFGTVFELTSEGVEKVLYSFGGSHPQDGGFPNAGLVFHNKGNLYGTTGDYGAYGLGTVFELTSEGTENVLYNFPGGPFGGESSSDLVFGKKGNLYGTTYYGGAQNYGTVFELTRKNTESVLYSFIGPPSDGYYPVTGLLFDKEGNLYGTTPGGGEYGYGVAFELSSGGTEKVLFSFGGYSGDAEGPSSDLTFDKAGNLYGTTGGGGEYGHGAIFELTPDGTEKILYSFGGKAGDGDGPQGRLVFGRKGSLYGETVQGGSDEGGAVFELTSDGNEKVLYSFGSQPGDGYYPHGGLVLDKEGNLYGTTFEGGGSGYGTVFKVAP